MLIARHGKIAYRQIGRRDRARAGRRWRDDAIFRIYSMTKPIVSVAAMMLVEEGRLLITDPVSKYDPRLCQREGRASSAATSSTSRRSSGRSRSRI